MKKNLCLLALSACLGPTLCWAEADEGAARTSYEEASSPPGMAVTSSRRGQAAPRGRRENNWRYRNENGRWWYWSADNRWSYWNGSRWTPFTGRERGLTPPRAIAGQGGAGPAAPRDGAAAEAPLGQLPLGPGMQGRRAGAAPLGGPAGQDFSGWFNAYRTFQTGAAPLRTAEQGGVEMGTAEITAEASATEVFEYGGIPRRQLRRPS